MGVEHDGAAAEPFDLVSLGETMAAFVPDAEGGRYRLAVLGGESNVAVGMAQIGCRTRWISRLGTDQLGALVADFLVGHGVDAQVEWDERHVTGVAVKELSPTGTRMRYYRSQSAARHLADEHARQIGPTRWTHITGVTPALSATCAALTASVLEGADRPGRTSFDINYRPALWTDSAQAARTLVPLARKADTVFIGDDEAETLLGTSDEAELRRQLLTAEGQEVVLKRGSGPASVVTATGSVTEPALRTPVVEVTGAGDAFAAGYLAASCWGWDAGERLRLGHLLAARVIGVTGDIAPTLARSELDRLLHAVRSSSTWEEGTA